jgi:hypothetical protein
MGIQDEIADPNAWYKTDPKGFVMEFRKQLDLSLDYINGLDEQGIRELAEDIQLARHRAFKEELLDQIRPSRIKPDMSLPPERLNKYGGSIKWLDKYEDDKYLKKKGGENTPSMGYFNYIGGYKGLLP